MMGISKSQAQALADGFLDNFGSDDKDSLQPRETFTELFLLAGEFVEDAQENLNRSSSNASGSLSASLELNEPTESNGVIKVDVMMNFYGQFLNAGVRGTKSGQGKYKFKSAFPSDKMVEALKKGISQATKKTSNVNRSRTVSRNEKKNANLSQIQKAYGAGRNIKMYGIKATGFIDKAVLKTESKISDRLGNALEIDIINSI